MNSFEPVFWMGSLLVVIRLADGSASSSRLAPFRLAGRPGHRKQALHRLFLIALLLGLILSPQRRILLSRWCLAGVAVLILLAMPNLLWQWANHFPTYEFLNRVAHSDKNLKLPPIMFLWEQVKILLWETAPLWIGGLVWLAFARAARAWRFVAFTYLIFLAMMMVMHAKDYYVSPIYPVLFAAGSVAFGQLTRRTWPLIAASVNFFVALVFLHRTHRSHHPAARQVQRLHRHLCSQQRPLGKVHQPPAASPLRPLRLAADGRGLRRALQRASAR